MLQGILASRVRFNACGSCLREEFPLSSLQANIFVSQDKFSRPRNSSFAEVLRRLRDGKPLERFPRIVSTAM
jgi:hypothetical protein